MGFYEFSDEENVVFTRTYIRMGIGSAMMVLAGLGLVVYALLELGTEVMSVALLLVLADGLILIGMGYFTFQASKRFKKIVDTQGHDITYLMESMDALTRLYTLIVVLIIAVSALVVISAPLV